MALAAERLRYEWLQDWIINPQAIFPGTKMPQYFTWDLDDPSFFTAPLKRRPRPRSRFTPPATTSTSASKRSRSDDWSAPCSTG